MIEFEKYPVYTSEEASRLAGEWFYEAADPQTRLNALREIMGFLDLTTLEGSDTRQRVTELCNKAWGLADPVSGIPAVAAVCVYPNFVRLCREQLAGKNIRVACVAGAFPSGQSPIHVKTAEVRYAVDEGADEVDMVISRGKFLEGDFERVFEEISAIREACGKAHLKVILETGELRGPSDIRKASEIAILAGASFIKTSTGKIQPAATPAAAMVMCQTIREYYEKTGIKIGFKPAGGISEPETALGYYFIVNGILGREWLNPEFFRIGASRLADKIVETIKN